MLSIIIPVYNQHDMTIQCLNMLMVNTSLSSEIIIIDNGSDPEFKPPFSGFIETRIIRNEKNKGFPRAVNHGIKEAKGSIIALLNNDTFVTPDWDLKLTSAIGSGFDIVGPVTNFCAGIQKVQTDTYENENQLEEIAMEWEQAYGGIIQEVNFVIGFCMAFKKEVYDQVGDFDETIWPCSGEEVDFCFRARELGFKVGIVEECYIHHEGSKTFQDLHDSGVVDYPKLFEKVDQYVEKKWGPNYWSKQAIQQIDSSLKFTGERAMPLDPDMPQDIMAEHVKRYEFALPYIENKTVLDAACGSGYGSDLMAEKARFVIGGDNSGDIIQYCKYHYTRENLRFAEFQVQDIPYPNSIIDIVISFETIEHIADGDKFLSEVQRILNDDGTLIISTPLGGPCGNPYHLTHYQKDSFKRLLSQYFQDIKIWYQGNDGFLNKSLTPDHCDTFSGEYAIAICSKKGR